MKRKVTFLLVALVVGCSFAVNAQTTYNVPPPSATDTVLLNEFIALNNDTTGVSTYVLQRDGYYVLGGQINYSHDIVIKAADGDGALPLIIYGVTEEGGSNGWGVLSTSGDTKLENIELNCSNVLGARGNWSNVGLIHSGIGTTVELDGCVVEWCDGPAIWDENGDQQSVILTNNVFRGGGISNGGRWQGFGTLIKNGTLELYYAENNTFYENYAPLLIHENGHFKDMFMNHNTIVSNAQPAVRVLHAANAVFMNNLIVDGFFGGEMAVDIGDEDLDSLPAGVYTIEYYREDTLVPETYPLESERVNLVAFNANYVTPELKAYWDAAPDTFVVADYTKGDNGFLNQRAVDMFTSAGDFDYPYFLWDATHSMYTDDPGLASFTVKADEEVEISKNMHGFESNVVTDNGTWGRYPFEGDDASAPLAKDVFTFEYTNTTYQVAGNCYPIGDLNWWPTDKAAWEAEKEDYAAIVASVKDGTFSFTPECVTAINSVENINNLVSVYPNPSNGLTTVTAELETAGMVNVVVYNVFGQQVMNVANEMAAAGVYTTNFNTSNLAAGTYLVKVNTNGQAGTQMLVVE